MEKSKLIFTYRMTLDTGFAPCVDNGLLTLACCKGGKEKYPCGLRFFIGRLWDYFNANPDERVEIYVSGIFQEKLLYFAKITDVIEMKEYFSSKEYKRRLDQIYELDGNELKHIEGNNTHNDPHFIKCDINGKYVLISNEFVYLGKNAIEVNNDILGYYPENRGQWPKGQHSGSPSDVLTVENKEKSSELYEKLTSLLKDNKLLTDNDKLSNKGKIPKPHNPIERGGCGSCGKTSESDNVICNDCGKE